MNILSGTFFLCLVSIMTGCGDAHQEWDKVTSGNRNWFYLVATEVRLGDPGPDAGIRDQDLILTSPEITDFDSFDGMTNQRVVLAMPVSFQTKLVTGAVRQAALPQLRGKVLPTVVDRKIEIHFLSQVDGKWHSTNTLRTRVVSVTNPL